MPGQGHQPPARGQQGEGRAHVAEVGAAPAAVHARGGGERRVHEHDRGPDVGQAVPDGLGVVAGHRSLGEQSFQKPRPHGGELVQVQRPCGPGPERALGKDGQHPGPGGGLQHHVPRAHPRGLEHRVGERERGGELLAGDLLLGAPGVGGLQRGEGFEHREHPLGGPGLAAHGAAPALQEQHERGLGRLVGVLPDPNTLGVGASEGTGQGRAQGGSVEGLPRLQVRQEGRGGGEQGAGLRAGVPGAGGVGRNANGHGRRAHGRIRRRMGVEHGGSPRGSGRDGQAGTGRRRQARPPPASGNGANGWAAASRCAVR